MILSNSVKYKTVCVAVDSSKIPFMRHYRVAGLVFVWLATSFAGAENPSLARHIDQILADPQVARGMWGIEAISLSSGQRLYSLNADKLFTPASNTKLFTTAATLALIGPDYHFQTTVEANSVVDKYGRLSGDLFLVGRGDPNLSGRILPYHLHTQRTDLPASIHALDELADQLVQKGVKFIDGDVVADDSYYVFERYGEGWTQDDLIWEWGAPVSALTLNDNVILMNILPGDRPGEHAFVNITPYAEYYRLDNRILTTAAGTGPRKIFINREPGANLVSLWGTIPADDEGANEELAIEDPADFAAQLFRGMLEKRGIVVYGRARSHHSELASGTAFTIKTTVTARGGDASPASSNSPGNFPLVLATYESQPLQQDLRVVNKVSQNLHAELLLRLLGRQKGAAPTIEGGLQVMSGFLTQAGILRDEYAFYDGSGLSRENLVTPHAIVKLLRYASQQPWGPLYEETLPVAGTDGSLADRFKAGIGEKIVHAKTGSLGHVNALSGYATTVKGERIAFSVMANNHTLTHKQALDTIDKIVEALVAEK
jgi:serine-type D-Ala-D-Ala carboxypeptidase/endopeptidase (penicillin-binding protein 4)